MESLVERWPGAAHLDPRRDTWHTLSLLRKAARYHDLTPCYPALAELLAEGHEKAGHVLQEALVRHPGDLTRDLLPALNQKDAARQAALACLKLQPNLTLARAALLQMLGGRRISWFESEFAKFYAGYLIDQRDYEALELLLLAEAEVSGAVSRVLAERDLDLAPLRPTLEGLVNDRHWWVREGAQLALRM